MTEKPAIFGNIRESGEREMERDYHFIIARGRRIRDGQIWDGNDWSAPGKLAVWTGGLEG